jgi:quinoprotein glucose dehydrogenase
MKPSPLLVLFHWISFVVPTSLPAGIKTPKTFLSGFVLSVCLTVHAAVASVVDWPVTGGDPGGMRSSPLTDINRTNVATLTVAWTYRYGDYRSGWPDPVKGTAFDSTPIVRDGRLIFTTPYNRVIALDPMSGRELWTFDPKIDKGRRFSNLMVNRGVAYWRAANVAGACDSRVFLATLDARLIALDAVTSTPCQDFGTQGSVNLLDGIEHVIDPWGYNVTSPSTIVGDNVIVGSTITANLDRGLIFLPVSTAGPDFIGIDRKGANLFSDAVVAVETKTGKYRWHFQTVHHDLWDYDFAAPPALVRVRHEGHEVDAVAQGTKTGLIFLLDRDTGKPRFPVEERPVPHSTIPGEAS